MRLKRGMKFINFVSILTHQTPVLPSYRNQSIDLRSKSVDWFLYENNTGI